MTLGYVFHLFPLFIFQVLVKAESHQKRLNERHTFRSKIPLRCNRYVIRWVCFASVNLFTEQQTLVAALGRGNISWRNRTEWKKCIHTTKSWILRKHTQLNNLSYYNSMTVWPRILWHMHCKKLNGEVIKIQVKCALQTCLYMHMITWRCTKAKWTRMWFLCSSELVTFWSCGANFQLHRQMICDDCCEIKL